MNEEVLNISIRKFLKMVGVNSQRAIEHAVAEGMERGLVAGDVAVPVRMTLEIATLELEVVYDGELKLE